jgi:hypothetical protein
MGLLNFKILLPGISRCLHAGALNAADSGLLVYSSAIAMTAAAMA